MSEGHAMQELDRLYDFLKGKFPEEAAKVGKDGAEVVDVVMALLGKEAVARGARCVACQNPATTSIYIEKAGRVGEPGERKTIFACDAHYDSTREQFIAALYSVTVKPIVRECHA